MPLFHISNLNICALTTVYVKDLGILVGQPKNLCNNNIYLIHLRVHQYKIELIMLNQQKRPVIKIILLY
uniref:Uncharacterized protein n=1 Tax=Meloidogyne enterolobii TaxID=390850 RepID=A0A6V7Y8J8_MELEN|nr:unnamed protein product [Meloidogyne enterolobii]